MPFFDYLPDPGFLLTIADTILRVISLIFAFILAIGPIGIIVVVAIPVGLFLRDIHAGPKAFKNQKA